MSSPPESNQPDADAVAESPAAREQCEPRRVNYRDPKIWIALSVLFVTLAGAAYLYFSGNSALPTAGSPKGGVPASSPAVTGPAKPLKALSDEQLERMVAQASSQTQKEPGNAFAWAMLAHSYEMLGKFAESAKAYAKLALLLPKDAQVLADYADVLAVVNGRSFKGEPFALLKRALAVDANNAKALLLAGSACIEDRDYVQAIAYLERARSVTTGTAFARQVEDSIAQAKVLSGDPSVASAAPAKKSGKGDVIAGAAAQVSGRVWLAEGLRAKAPAQATLFLFARPADGSRMPVALIRKKVSDLPMNFTLDDSMAMVPDASFSKLSKVVVVARISIKGDVMPAAGDLEGKSAPVAVGTKDLKLEITEVLK